MFKARFALMLVVGLLACGCSERTNAPRGGGSGGPGGTTGGGTARTEFQLSDRTVKLDSFLRAFPYDLYRRMGSLKHNSLFTLKSDGSGTRFLKVTVPAAAPAVELGSGKTIANVDVSKSLTFNWKMRKTDGALFISMDQNNDERFNLYRLDEANGALIKLTNVAYITGYEFSPDEKKIAYLARVAPQENSRIQAHVLDLASGEDKVIGVDDETTNFYWSTVAWIPDAKKLAVVVVTKFDRKKVDVALLDVDGAVDQKPLVITETKDRAGSDVVKQWLNEKEVLFRSNEEGSLNLYSINVETKEKKKLTDLKADIDAPERTELNGKTYYTFTTASPKGGTVQRFDPATKQLREIFRSTDDLTLIDAEAGEVLVGASGHGGPVNVYRFPLQARRARNAQPVVVLDAALKAELVHCKSEELRYPTFDTLTYTVEGEKITGEIMATLYTPLKPAPADQAKGLIRAFYGGSLNFDVDAQLLCALGYTVLSPAARGDGAISSEYEKINDGDLGGNEIIDIIYGGKFLATKTGIPSERIGVFGHSHGGYATQRLMTFEGEVNGHTAQFDWGFGLANSGFCDIVNQTETSNIKGWTLKEAGDPADAAARAKMDARSPINHTDKLKGRLLLVHGDGDKRVPFPGSQRIFDKLVAEGKAAQVKLVTISGMGHAPASFSNRLEYYGAWIEFLK